MDDELALKVVYIQRRLREISKEAERLRTRLRAAEAKQRQQLVASIAQTLLQELQDRPPR